MAAFSIGVDLGGTNLRVAAVDDKGEILESLDSLSEIRHGKESVVARLTDAVRFLSRKYSSSHSFKGVGVGLPGIIDLETGTLHSAANLPGWSGYAAREDLEAKLGATVVLENDANCAALGEKWLGAGRGANDLCMITLGTGVGGGFEEDRVDVETMAAWSNMRQPRQFIAWRPQLLMKAALHVLRKHEGPIPA